MSLVLLQANLKAGRGVREQTGREPAQGAPAGQPPVVVVVGATVRVPPSGAKIQAESEEPTTCCVLAKHLLVGEHSVSNLKFRGLGHGKRRPLKNARFTEIWGSVRRIFALYLPSLERLEEMKDS